MYDSVCMYVGTCMFAAGNGCISTNNKIVIPIHENGNRNDIENYRGVNIMPNFAKVFEKTINNQLKLIIPPLLSKSQHGFLLNRNIETNLMEFFTYINEAFEKQMQVDVFFVGIRKAFDKVKQLLVIWRMAKYPVSYKFLVWIQQYVNVGCSKSETFNIPSSVVQDTILSPLLFLALSDDSDERNGSTKAFNFADDKKNCIYC